MNQINTNEAPRKVCWKRREKEARRKASSHSVSHRLLLFPWSFITDQCVESPELKHAAITQRCDVARLPSCQVARLRRCETSFASFPVVSLFFFLSSCSLSFITRQNWQNNSFATVWELARRASWRIDPETLLALQMKLPLRAAQAPGFNDNLHIVSRP